MRLRGEVVSVLAYGRGAKLASHALAPPAAAHTPAPACTSAAAHTPDCHMRAQERCKLKREVRYLNSEF